MQSVNTPLKMADNIDRTHITGCCC